ncbi:MAG: MmgE/PrpD family protein [bacterium]
MPTDCSLIPLAEFISGLTLGDIPASVLTKARMQLASALAAALGARLDPAVRKIQAGIAGRGTEGPVTVLTTGARAPLHDAVLANATSTCAFDWDEILLLGHPSHSAVTVSLGVAEERALPLGDALVAQVAANEVGGRFGLACFFGPQNGQHLPFLHHVSAAAAASKLFGLDAERTAHALAIALAQPQTALWPAFVGAIESKVLTAAHPTELGLSAAEHSAAGLRGPLHILDHQRGFFSRFSFLPGRAALGGLGVTWLSETLQVKRHAACWYFQAPLDAAERLLQRTGPLRAVDIRGLHCGATLLATAVHGLAAGDRSTLLPNTMNFQLDLSLAQLLLSGKLTPVELSPERLAQDAADLRRVAQVTQIEHAAKLSRATLQAVHRAVDVAGLLGGASALDIATALARARREFHGMQGPALAELGELLGSTWDAVRALRRSRRRSTPYDFADSADAVAGLALPCGGTVTLTLADGSSLTETVEIPSGALHRLAEARLVVDAKLHQGLAIAGVDTAARNRAVSAALDAPLDRSVASLLADFVETGTGAR